MKFSIFSELSYEVFSPATFLFNIQPVNNSSQIILEESLSVSPFLTFTEFALQHSESRYIKLQAGEPCTFTILYQAEVAVTLRIVEEEDILQAARIIELDTEVLPYLFPSRHCQSDKLRKFAIKEFGYLDNDYSKVLAINDWIFDNTDYISGTTDSGTSAYDTLIQREGVCKDFAHLGIALCRASDIPARYFTGYAHDLYPPDFHACFEAYIGGQWIFFDPTRLVPLNGLVKIAHSKDAAEAAVANFFGHTQCTYMDIRCVAEPSFVAFAPEDGKRQALSYE